MRVLMTADAVGGVWPYALELSRALGAHDVDVVLAVMGPPPTAAGRDAVRALGNATMYERAFRLEWMPDPWSDVDRAGEWLRDIADRERVDVVHLNGYSHAALEWTVPVLVVAHSCVTSWWRAVHDTRAPAEWDEYRARVLAGLRCAGRVVAPTRAMLRALEREYEPIESGVVIPNGCTTLSTGARRKEDFILSAGRVWDEAKNITLLDAAAPSVPWTIRVAGEATAPDGSTRTPANVALMGRLSGDALIDWMERASIFALPARYEPFGLAALEAAQCGCALVLGDIETQREVWDDGALFVAPDDAGELAATLRRLIDDPALRSTMAARAFARAQRYSPVAMAAAYAREYHSLANLNSNATANANASAGSGHAAAAAHLTT